MTNSELPIDAPSGEAMEQIFVPNTKTPANASSRLVCVADVAKAYENLVMKGPIKVIATLVELGHTAALQDVLPGLLEQLSSFPDML